MSFAAGVLNYSLHLALCTQNTSWGRLSAALSCVVKIQPPLKVLNTAVSGLRISSISCLVFFQLSCVVMR